MAACAHPIPSVEIPPGCLDGHDFRGANLAGVDLSKRSLVGADFSEAQLSGANLMGANVRDALFVKAVADAANFLAADLTGSDWTEASAVRVGFGQAILDDVCAFSADFSDASLVQVSARNADFRAAKLAKARAVDANFSGTSFFRADLREFDITRSTLSECCFDESDMRRSKLRAARGYDSATWIHADIQDVDFCGAFRLRRFVMDQNYLFEFRSESAVNAALFWVWRLTSDCGRSVLRWGVTTLVIASLFSFLYGVVAVDLGDHPTPLSLFYFSIVTLTTLGYGDVLPASLPAQVVVLFEVVLGYLMLGGLLSIVSNKMARRAD